MLTDPANFMRTRRDMPIKREATLYFSAVGNGLV